jgi:hypothetical protein
MDTGDAEIAVLSALVNGPLGEGGIIAVPDAGLDIDATIKTMEAVGLLKISPDSIRLTRAGLRYAISKGIMPAPAISALDNLPPADELPSDMKFTHAVPMVSNRLFWTGYFARCILFAIWLHFMMVLLMRWTGYARIW